MIAPSDELQRRLGTNPNQSFVVRSPAGSGKTSLLIERFLRLLLIVQHPEEILAITFTTKAAGEMRSRIVESLRKKANESSYNSYDVRLNELALKVQKRDEIKGWRLVEQPAKLRIETIDALCLNIVKQRTWASGMGAEVSPIADASEHYHAAIRDAFELIDDKTSEWRSDLIAILKYFDNDLPRVEKLLVSLLAKRDQWLRYSPLFVGDEAKTRQGLEAGWVMLGEQAVVELKLKFTDPQLAVIQHIALIVQPSLIVDDTVRSWCEISKCLLTKNGNIRKRLLTKAQLTGEPQDFENSVTEISHLFDVSKTHREAFQNLSLIGETEYTEHQWKLLWAIMRVLKLCAALLKIVFSERGQVDFIGLSMAASEALGSPDAPTDLALSLDWRLQHLLVDEFQDTSYSQIELLKSLTQGWEYGDGKTIFLVGDPMQSIYRFREADVGLFLDAGKKFLDNVRPKILTLSCNFRSVPPIVEWVNATFPKIFSKIEDATVGAVSYTPSISTLERSTNDGVVILPLIDGGPRIEADSVVNLVRSLLEQDALQSIAVIVRARSHLPEILGALSRAGIVYRGVGLAALDQIPAVQDLLSLTRAWLYPTDRVAWLAVLRSPMCGLSLKDLEILSINATRTFIECLENDDVLADLSSDGRRRLMRLRIVYRDYLNVIGRWPLAVSIENIWRRLGGPATVHEIHMPHVDEFFSLMGDWDQESDYVDIDRFIRVVEKSFVSTGLNASRVEVMTIHNAKGLEFDTVIIPGLDRRAMTDEKAVLVWSELSTGAKQHLLIAPLEYGQKNTSSFYERIRSNENKRLDNELSRLLYVGVTRARRKLYLIGAVKRGKGDVLSKPVKGSLLDKLWPVVGKDFLAVNDSKHISEAVDVKGTSKSQTLYRLPIDYMETSSLAAGFPDNSDDCAAIVEFEWAGVTAKHIGTVIHDELRLMSSHLPRDWKSMREQNLVWKNRLVSLGVSSALLAGALRRVQKAIRLVRADGIGRWILNPTNTDARSEFSISGWVGDQFIQGIIDRTFVDGGMRWIIDYKTGYHDGSDLEIFLKREWERYQPQLNRYSSLMAGLDNRPIKLGLYFPLHTRFVTDS